MECFATQDTGNGIHVIYYYGSIFYRKAEVPRSGEALEEGRTSATKHDFQSCAIRLGQKAKCPNGQTLNAWLVPEKLNCMLFIKNARSISGENEDTSDVALATRSCSVVFEEPYTLRGKYSIHDQLTIFVKRDIEGSEELFTDYSADYNFQYTCPESYLS